MSALLFCSFCKFVITNVSILDLPMPFLPSMLHSTEPKVKERFGNCDSITGQTFLPLHLITAVGWVALVSRKWVIWYQTLILRIGFWGPIFVSVIFAWGCQKTYLWQSLLPANTLLGGVRTGVKRKGKWGRKKTNARRYFLARPHFYRKWRVIG